MAHGLFTSLFPLHFQFSFVYRAVPQVKIDQGLIGDTGFVGQRFKIFYGIFIQPQCDGLFQILYIRVFFTLHFRKIVMLSHVL